MSLPWETTANDDGVREGDLASGTNLGWGREQVPHPRRVPIKPHLPIEDLADCMGEALARIAIAIERRCIWTLKLDQFVGNPDTGVVPRDDEINRVVRTKAKLTEHEVRTRKFAEEKPGVIGDERRNLGLMSPTVQQPQPSFLHRGEADASGSCEYPVPRKEVQVHCFTHCAPQSGAPIVETKAVALRYHARSAPRRLVSPPVALSVCQPRERSSVSPNEKGRPPSGIGLHPFTGSFFRAAFRT